jgi:hypothetical protein
VCARHRRPPTAATDGQVWKGTAERQSSLRRRGLAPLPLSAHGTVERLWGGDIDRTDEVSRELGEMASVVSIGRGLRPPQWIDNIIALPAFIDTVPPD